MRSALLILVVACSSHSSSPSDPGSDASSPLMCEPIAPRAPVAFTARSDGLAPLDSVAPPAAGPDVVDFGAAVRLGKALFWDTQVGGDGKTACATCHFAAGADARRVNTVSPGPNGAFESLGVTGPEQLAQQDNIGSDDRIGSQGVVAMTFAGLDPDPAAAADRCTPATDPPFTGHRQVTARNAPSVIGAALYRELFWDGRANHAFNGIDPFGATANAGGTATLVLEGGALASQAVGPANNGVEMACADRGFDGDAGLGAKLLARTPLAHQAVAPTDGVLGCLAGDGAGLRCGDHACTYGELIERAFGPTLGTQNFARVFGQAIAAYESTLLADATPYDRFLRGDMHALTTRQHDGFDVFANPLTGCINCHAGAELSDASLSFATAHGLVNVDGGDQGFHHTGVRPTSALHSEDLGRAGLGPNQATYSVSKAVADRGAFKTPQLRDIALTAPYFHNGGKATLDDVIDFYDGGGDFTASASQIHALILLPNNRQALLDFLQNALTDCRVANSRAPFDHPAIDVPNGPSLAAVGAEGNGPCP